MGILSGGYIAVADTQALQIIDTHAVRSGDNQFAVLWSLGFTSIDSPAAGTPQGVYGQLINRDGSRSGEEFFVPATTGESNLPFSLTPLEDGGLLVSWISQTQNRIFAQVLDSSGSPAGEHFELVDFGVSSVGGTPAVVTLPNEEFFVFWQSLNGGIFGKKFNTSGEALSDDTYLLPGPTVSSGFRLNAVAVGGDNAAVMLVWTDRVGESGTAVLRQLVDSSLGTVGTTEAISEALSEPTNFSAVTALANGDLVVTWNDRIEGGGTFDFGVFAQRFDSAGDALAPVFRVDSMRLGWVSRPPQLIALEDGGFLIQYSREGVVDGIEIFARYYDVDGVAQGPELKITTITTHAASLGTGVELGDGGVVSTFDGAFQFLDVSGSVVDTVDGIAIDEDLAPHDPASAATDRLLPLGSRAGGAVGFGEDSVDQYTLAAETSTEFMLFLSDFTQGLELQILDEAGEPLEVNRQEIADSIILQGSIDAGESYRLSIAPSESSGSAYRLAIFEGRDFITLESPYGIIEAPQPWERLVLEDDGDLIPHDLTALFRIYGALGRAPDIDGFEFYAGDHAWDVAAAIVASDEFRGLADSDGDSVVSNEEFVTHLFATMLNREADPEGFDWWTEQRDAGAQSQATALLGFANSDEYVFASAAAISGWEAWDLFY